MGFYGNITNTSRTQFVFDRTYSNRAQMDSFANADGVYIGRYVLVEYDTTLAADWCTDVYMDDGVFYTSPLKENNTKILYGVGNIVAGKYLRVPAAYIDPVTKKEIIHNFDAMAENKYKDLIYLILTSENAKEPNVELMSESTSTYVENYQIDMKQYGEGRGYDSTVWQKVYTDNHERYVMIAELNTVVPTFGISADAPTMSPMAPHFDVDSSNVYYKVHWQPSWGLRVKTASPIATAVAIDNAGATINGVPLIDLSDRLNTPLPSDETTVWKRPIYNASTGKLITYGYEASFTPEGNISSGAWRANASGSNIPAAIFYNRAGFKPEVVGEIQGYADKITLEPTGKSGYLYNNHDGKGTLEAQVDTQELSIILPSIGNTISKVWDLVYGGVEENNGSKRNLNITWSDGSIVPNLSGLRMVTKKNAGYGYEPNQVNTIAGAINSVHDLMGMIVQEKDNLASINPNELSTEYIYFDKKTGKYFRKNKKYELVPINTADIDWNNRYIPIDQYNNDDWDLENGHNNYYLDYVPSNPKTGNGDIFPNYILERYTRYEDKEYYKVPTPDPNSNLAVKGEELLEGVFQPRTYYTKIDKTVLVEEKLETTKSYVISMDDEYKAETAYYKLTYEPLPDNARFYVQGVYYKVSEETEVINPNINDFNKRLYFIKENGRYIRPAQFDDTGATKYYVLTFDAENDNIGNYQYFAVNSKVENGYNYVERITYIKDPSITSQDILDSLNTPRYTVNNSGAYTVTTTYVEGTEYYYKHSTLELVQGGITVSGENVNEVVLMPFEENSNYCYHIPAGMGGLNGFNEFVILTNKLLTTYTDNLVQVATTPVNDIYEPNTHYYQITDTADPLYGSYVFDPEDFPVADRIYYKPEALQLGEKVNNNTQNIKVYEPYKYYYVNDDGDYILDTRKTLTDGITLYEKKGLYVYNDATGIYPNGTEWNLNIRTLPNGVQLAERSETWGVEELTGFARHYNTIHGLILRLNDILEQKNELIRDYDTAQGLMNKIKDILFMFGDLKGNEVVVTDDYGRIITTKIKGDNKWIGDALHGLNGAIQISHSTKSTNDIVYSLNGLTKATDDEILNARTETILSFGDSITQESYKLKFDQAGHAYTDYTTVAKKDLLTLPIITFEESVSKNGGNVITAFSAIDLNTSNAKLGAMRQWVGTLQLDAEFNLIANDKTGIAPTDTITGAFAKVNTAFNNAYDEIQATEDDIREDMALITSTIPLTGYTIYSGQASPLNDTNAIGVTATDTINSAFAKVNEKFAGLELEKYKDALRILGISGTSPDYYTNVTPIDERIKNHVDLELIEDNYGKTIEVETYRPYFFEYASGYMEDEKGIMKKYDITFDSDEPYYLYSSDGIHWEEKLFGINWSDDYTYQFKSITYDNIGSKFLLVFSYYDEEAGAYKTFLWPIQSISDTIDFSSATAILNSALLMKEGHLNVLHFSSFKLAGDLWVAVEDDNGTEATEGWTRPILYSYDTINNSVTVKRVPDNTFSSTLYWTEFVYDKNTESYFLFSAYNFNNPVATKSYVISTDKGDSWTVKSNLPASVAWSSAYESDGTIIIIPKDQAYLYYSVDSGTSWVQFIPPFSSSTSSVICLPGKNPQTGMKVFYFYDRYDGKVYMYSSDMKSYISAYWEQLKGSDIGSFDRPFLCEDKMVYKINGIIDIISPEGEEPEVRKFTNILTYSSNGLDLLNNDRVKFAHSTFLPTELDKKELLGFDYTLSPTYTGNNWIDGRPIMRQVFMIGDIGTTVKSIPLNTGKLSTLVSFKAFGIKDGDTMRPIPFTWPHSTNGYATSIVIKGWDTDSPYFYTQAAASGIVTDVYVILEYTYEEVIDEQIQIK